MCSAAVVMQRRGALTETFSSEFLSSTLLEFWPLWFVELPGHLQVPRFVVFLLRSAVEYPAEKFVVVLTSRLAWCQAGVETRAQSTVVVVA